MHEGLPEMNRGLLVVVKRAPVERFATVTAMTFAIASVAGAMMMIGPRLAGP